MRSIQFKQEQEQKQLTQQNDSKSGRCTSTSSNCSCSLSKSSSRGSRSSLISSSVVSKSIINSLKLIQICSSTVLCMLLILASHTTNSQQRSITNLSPNAESNQRFSRTTLSSSSSSKTTPSSRFSFLDKHAHNFSSLLNSFGDQKQSTALAGADIDNDDLSWYETSNNSVVERFENFEKSSAINEYSANKSISDCSSLFENCLCSFYQETERNFLYCNHPSVRHIPDFQTINRLFDTHIRPKQAKANLIFAKVDFKGSSIRKIWKNDLSYLKLDMLNQNADNNKNIYGLLAPKGGGNANSASNIAESLLTNVTTAGKSLNAFENFLEQLKKVILPKYHLDFEGIVDIEDSAFAKFIENSINISYQFSSSSIISATLPITSSPSSSYFDNLRSQLLLKIRFSDSQFNFAPHRKPFAGLKALEFHINNMSTEYLANSIFDASVIQEFYLDDAPNFIGFLDLSESLPTGKLLNRFVVTRSYKIDSLCSHSLPSFVDFEQFFEIQIKKCANLKSIKAFTFYRYSHLKSLILASNNFAVLDRDCFRNLNQLVSLDLSSNPIVTIDDETFRDLNSLKSLYLESTQLKQLGEHSLVGLLSLVELKLSKSSQLSEIHGGAFRDSQKSLKELHLKDTQVKLLESISKDGTEPPYFPENLNKQKQSWPVLVSPKPVWPSGLNLTLLNLDSSSNNEEFAAKKFTSTNPTVSPPDPLLCKLIRYLPATTLLNLQRNQSCNCLVYLVYRRKEFPTYQRWEYKAPFCYRDQIQIGRDGTRSYEALRKREIECDLPGLEKYCFPTPTTILPTTTTITSTTTTTTKPTTTTISPVIIVPVTTETTSTTSTTTTRKRTRYTNMPTNQNKKGGKTSRSWPVVNLKKLAQVILVIAILTAMSIMVTIGALRFAKRVDKRKKIKKQVQTVRQQRSSSSSTQTTLNNPSIASSKQKKIIVMPPSVIPPFNPKLPIAVSKKSLSQPPSALNQLISQTTGSQFTGFGQVNLRNPNETNLLLMQDMALQNQQENNNNNNNQTASFTLND